MFALYSFSIVNVEIEKKEAEWGLRPLDRRHRPGRPDVVGRFASFVLFSVLFLSLSLSLSLTHTHTHTACSTFCVLRTTTEFRNTWLHKTTDQQQQQQQQQQERAREARERRTAMKSRWKGRWRRKRATEPQKQRTVSSSFPTGRRRRQSDARGAASGWVSVGSALTAASVAVADAEDVGRRGSCVATAGRWGCVACVAARNTPSSIVSDARLNPFADRRLIALIFTRWFH